MPDIYAEIAQVDNILQEQIAAILELRAADTQQQEILNSYLSRHAWQPGTHVLEIGCGTGAVCRTLASLPHVQTVVGVDPSTIFLEHARRNTPSSLGDIRYVHADGRQLPQAHEEFDVVIFHTTLCHIPGAEQVIEEAYRVLKTGGALIIFDGDYAATSLAIGPNDPLEAVAQAAIDVIAHDRYFVRKMPKLVQDRGFTLQSIRAHAYTGMQDDRYIATLLERGVHSLVQQNTIGENLAHALRAEGLERVAQGRFFGLVNYASLLATK